MDRVDGPSPSNAIKGRMVMMIKQAGQDWRLVLRLWFGICCFLWVVACNKASTEPCGTCTEGEKRCKSDQTALLLCKKLESTGCTTFTSQACPAGETCTTTISGEVACAIPQNCQDQCGGGEKRCVDNNKIESCLPDLKGCLVWTPQATCAGTKVCDPATFLCVDGGCQATNPQKEQRCVGNDVYWFDDCDQQGNLVESCASPKICQAGKCVDTGCQPTNPQKEQRCVGNDVYWFDDCGMQGTLVESCTAPKTCQTDKCVDPGCQVTNPQKEKRCVGSDVYWFDDCDKQGSLVESCTANQKCETGQCKNIGCQVTNPQAEKRCVGNNIHWYDDCGQLGALVEVCQPPQSCQNAQCQGCQPTNPQKEKRCVGNNVYWFDDCGVQGTLAQSCTGSSTCQSGSCVDPCASQNQCLSNQTRCSGTQIQECLPNGQGCLLWNSPRDCGGSLTCQGGICILDPAKDRQCKVSDPITGSCSQDNECCLGQTCQSAGIFKGCGPCSKDSDCPSSGSPISLIVCCIPTGATVGVCTSAFTCGGP